MSDVKPDARKIRRAAKQASPAAQRALKEAEARRKSENRKAGAKEVGGHDGPDPARYGDWEKNGILSDF